MEIEFVTKNQGCEYRHILVTSLANIIAIDLVQLNLLV